MQWQEFENKTRKIASFIWDSECRGETIGGVRIDGICKLRPDHWILIEITQETTIAKLRVDLAKFVSVKPGIMNQGIYPECYFVTEKEPNPSLIQTGEESKIEVLSFNSLEKKFLDYDHYRKIRSSLPFGSAIHQETGKKDDNKYVKVKYRNEKDGNQYTLEDIIRLLRDSKKIILIGDYGTGKSRCIQELFESIFSKRTPASTFPLAINLRENWGTRRGAEIIRRHFDDLGLSRFTDNVMRVISKSGSILLLDGFDEIASQTWSDDPATLKELRANALAGVKDLIKKTEGGLLIAGRQHYFNTNNEMYHCLGLDEHKTVLVRCEDEFTNEEMEEYLHNITADLKLPGWLPRKPIICKIASDIDKNILNTVFNDETGEVDFWSFFIRAICDREAKINPSLDSETIRNILIKVASITRVKPGDLGPITVMELNEAFQQVVGKKPSDESSIILQRLPTLIRVAGDSSDRQFIDLYVLDGLRADHINQLLNSVIKDTEPVFDIVWNNPLKQFGLTVVADYIDFIQDNKQPFTLMSKASHSRNQVLAGDILSALCINSDNLDCKNLLIKGGDFYYLDLSDRNISNLIISNCYIENLDISNLDPTNVQINNCIMTNLLGISGPQGFPAWMNDCEVENFTIISTVSRIKTTQSLTQAQKIFLTIIKKTYFQPGAGRKEAALLRGWGDQADGRIANKIINLLLDEGALKRFKGDEGWVYIPIRGAFSRRMSDIREKLGSSDDPLWLSLNGL